MKRNHVLFAFFLSAQIAVVANGYAQTTVSADPPPPRLAKSASLDSINPPTNDQFTRLCANTADPADCGKRVEAQQLKQPSAASIVRRDGKLLAITVPGEPPFIFEDIDSEAGPNVSFYSYSAPADAIVLYRSRGDKIEFVLIHRATASVTEIPNEPKFNSDGRYFVTADFCAEGCENRLSVWRMERRGPVRERVFAPRIAWSDADASWGSPRRLVVDITEGGRSSSINLDLNDPRWSILLP
ncbi:MAG: hypothetical protein EAZ37_14975 [Burkholderiales bacterium]|nr:MAG: hypothetical protein EAZ37_14975 [Burkholderiales bacterium]